MRNHPSTRLTCLAAVLALTCAVGPVAAYEHETKKDDVFLEPPPLDGAPGFDAMAEIFEEGLAAAQRADLGPAARRQGLEQAAQAIELSGINVMPTPGVEVTEEMFKQGIEMRQGVKEVADRIVQDGEVDDQLAAFALELAAMQKAKIDTLMTLARWTRTIDPESKKAHKLARNIRAPFVPFAGSRTPHKEIRTGEIAEGECFIVLKEIQGVKAKLIPELIPVWIEPWFERRRIVGFRVVWRLQFMPAEWVKRLSTCKIDGRLEHDDHQTIVYEPLLLDLWRFYGKH